MVNFNLLRTFNRFTSFTCSQCGDEDRGPEGTAICTLCQYYEANPAEAPGYFTWSSNLEGWAATAKWREKEPVPEPGQTVTVHRKDGGSSEHRVRGTLDRRYDPAANLIITLSVK